MNRAEKLVFCNKCVNRKLDLERGLVCKLTMEPADFGDECPSFVEDESLANLKEFGTAEIENDSLVRVDHGTRFGNYLLDMIAYFLISFGVGAGLVIMDFDLEFYPVLEFFIDYIIMFIYYVSFEAAFGQTPGKFLTNTIVLTKSGEKPDFATIAGRTLCRMVPFDALSFLGKSASGWHDRWSSTIVVKKTAAVEQHDVIDDLDRTI
jgi:uncharacterized RDD family membrane protein YckC